MQLKDKGLKSYERTYTEGKIKLLLRAWDVLQSSSMICWHKTQLFGVYAPHYSCYHAQMKRSANAYLGSCIAVSSAVVCSSSWTGGSL